MIRDEANEATAEYCPRLVGSWRGGTERGINWRKTGIGKSGPGWNGDDIRMALFQLVEDV